MGSFADYLENKVLDHIFGKGIYIPPTIYVALSTADPGDDGAGLSEPSGNGYARKSTTTDDWNSSTGGTLDNANVITFAEASGDWGAISHFALMDAAAGGNLLAYGALSASKSIGSGVTARFETGDLNISLD